MGSEMQDDMRAQAIEWHIQLRHADDAAWEEFADWLAQNPGHADAYDAIEQADLVIDPLLPEIVFRQAANDEDETEDGGDTIAAPEAAQRRYRRWGMVGGAIAASVAVLLAVSGQFTSSRYDISTGPGEQRTVTLDADTQVALNGSTRMTFDHKNPRFAALAEGEAMFQVRHDSSKPFSLEVGADRVVDVGTVFNVVHDAGEIRLAVAQGQVAYNSKDTSTQLIPGEVLVANTASGAIHVAKTPIASIGGWRKGHLTYSGQSLSQVAEDLSRLLGLHIVASPGIADRPFSGTLNVNGRGIKELRRLAPLLDISLKAGAQDWTMEPLSGAER